MKRENSSRRSFALFYLCCFSAAWITTTTTANANIVDTQNQQNRHHHHQNAIQQPRLFEKMPIERIEETDRLHQLESRRKLSDGKGKKYGYDDATYYYKGGDYVGGEEGSSKGKGKGGKRHGKGKGGLFDDSADSGKGKGSYAPAVSKGKGYWYYSGKGGKSDKSYSGKGKGDKSTKSTKDDKKKLTRAPSPQFPTVAPTRPGPTPPSATPAPQTPPPTPPQGTPTRQPTPGPTSDDFPTVQLSPYEVLYTIIQNRFILPSEYEELANVTERYLNNFFSEQFATSAVAQFSRTFTLFVRAEFSFGDPVEVEFNTTVQFSQSTSDVPDQSELDLILEDAFSGNNAGVYQQFVVDNIDSTNPFDTTSETSFQFVEESAENEDGSDPVTGGNPGAASESDEATAGETVSTERASSSGPSTTAYIAAGAAAGLMAFVIFVFGVNTYDRRKGQHEAIESMEKQSVGSHTDNETFTSATASQWDSATMASKIRQAHSTLSGMGQPSLQEQQPTQYQYSSQQNLHFDQSLQMDDSYGYSMPHLQQQQEDQSQRRIMSNNEDDDDDDIDDDDSDEFDMDHDGDGGQELFDDEQDGRFTDIPLSTNEYGEQRGTFS